MRKKTNMHKFSRAFKVSALCLEILMSIPVFAWGLTVSTGFPILILLFFHTLSLIIARKTDAASKILGNILGIFAAFLSIFPVIGWLLHVITVTVLTMEIRKSKNRIQSKEYTTKLAQQ